MNTCSWIWSVCVLLTISIGSGVVSATQDRHEAQDLEQWFVDESAPQVPQTEGQLMFLQPAPDPPVLHSHTTMVISDTSLADGWARLSQCYEGLDAVPEAEVVYRYREMRGLQVRSATNIGKVVPGEQSVQLFNVGQTASLCVGFGARLVHLQADGSLVIRHGPYHRKFLDGYFPMHVSLEVLYPSSRLSFLRTSPEAQPGFELDVMEGRIRIESWFAGKLSVAVYFSVRPNKHRRDPGASEYNTP
jgi:hypothetical protein